MALTLGKDRSKLSKRHGATALREYREQGYLPEAMFNYLALLGWNPGDGREVISREELIEAFSLERLRKSGAIFDSEKLDWMNGKYVQQLFERNPDELVKRSLEFFPSNSKAETQKPKLLKILEIEKNRIKKLSDLKRGTAFFFERPEYDKELLRWKGAQDFANIKKHLEAAKKIIAEDGDVMVYAELHGRGEVLWPLRAALSGRTASPGPFEIIEVLGKEKTIARIEIALKKLHDALQT
jgi:glutamyl/glutaminyl-tRNA synthetase